MATRGKTTSKKRREKSPERFVKGIAGGFPKGRLIWARLFEAEAMEEGNDPSYSCAVWFKGDTDIDAIREGIKAACTDQFGSSKPPRRSHTCLIEGDDLQDLIDDGAVPEGVEPDDVILKMRRLEKYGPVQKWDQNVEEIESPSELYSGCHVTCDVEFFGWERSSGSGISCRLNGIQKLKDDEPLGGGKNDTEESFSKVKVDKKDRKDRDDDDDRPSRRSRRDRDDDDDDI